MTNHRIYNLEEQTEGHLYQITVVQIEKQKYKWNSHLIFTITRLINVKIITS